MLETRLKDSARDTSIGWRNILFATNLIKEVKTTDLQDFHKLSNILLNVTQSDSFNHS